MVYLKKGLTVIFHFYISAVAAEANPLNFYWKLAATAYQRHCDIAVFILYIFKVDPREVQSPPYKVINKTLKLTCALSLKVHV